MSFAFAVLLPLSLSLISLSLLVSLHLSLLCFISEEISQRPPPTHQVVEHDAAGGVRRHEVDADASSS